jgi:hypothetical protein
MSISVTDSLTARSASSAEENSQSTEDRPDVARAVHLLSRDEARRVNIAKLVDLLRKPDPTRC